MISAVARKTDCSAAISAGEPRLPDFLIAGVQKGGTTWLWKMLRQHPEVRVPPRKEIHYFDRLILREPVEWYMRQLVDPKGCARIAGEKTPCYAHMKRRSIRLIRDLVPSVKIVLLLRRPDDRAWSQARMEVSRYNKRALEPRHVGRCVFQTGLLRNTRRTDYRHILQNWLSVFPAEQVLVGFYDEIERDPAGLLARICEFLGVGDAPLDATAARERVWTSPTVKTSPAVTWYLRRRYRRVSEWVAERFPEEAAQWLEGDSPEVTGTLFEKAKVLLTAYLATLPYNMAYFVYDVIRDLRMSRRIRCIRRELGRPAAIRA